MRVFIKNMVSNSCKILVRMELDKLSIKYKNLEIGHVDLLDGSYASNPKLKKALENWGFEILTNKKNIISEKIKTVIIEMLDFTQDHPKTNYSVYISSKLLYDYTYLSNVFSEVEHLTIEHFIISYKIDKAKELLLLNQYNISEIANLLNYSDVAHLSRQFKKITGLTPSAYKYRYIKESKPLDDL